MYEQTFGTEWETLPNSEAAVRRAFALGVAERLGEHHPEELDRITAEIDTTYEQSFVELAYQKGREEAGKVDQDTEKKEVWAEVVEGKTTIEAPDRSDADTGNDDDAFEGLPDALQSITIDTLPADSTEVVERPSFLERDGSKRRQRMDGERTMFGRSVDRTRRSQQTETEDGDEDEEPEESSESGDPGDQAESSRSETQDGNS